ncbi:hypothetical protein [Saccharothrix variisporea]|uniref:hypothetical protein n=1 Tax=Saccharothrix variisporea TaxID=543527 RepID=UPI0011C489AF|nr:hypothetical protein [Saccharothrix variisporea]
MPEVFPWVRLLPAQDVRELVAEVVDASVDTDDPGTGRPVDAVIESWELSARTAPGPGRG